MKNFKSKRKIMPLNTSDDWSFCRLEHLNILLFQLKIN